MSAAETRKVAERIERMVRLRMIEVAETIDLALAGLETIVVSVLKAEADRFPKAIREALDAAAREREGGKR